MMEYLKIGGRLKFQKIVVAATLRLIIILIYWGGKVDWRYFDKILITSRDFQFRLKNKNWRSKFIYGKLCLSLEVVERQKKKKIGGGGGVGVKFSSLILIGKKVANVQDWGESYHSINNMLRVVCQKVMKCQSQQIMVHVVEERMVPCQDSTRHTHAHIKCEGWETWWHISTARKESG